MSAAVSVNINDRATPAVRNLLAALSGPEREDINRAAGTHTMKDVRKYYREYGGRGGWENPAARTHGPGRQSTRFAAQVINGWNHVRPDTEGFTLVHASDDTSPILAAKIHGTTIRPKEKDWLTIPNVPEAHGKRVAEYEIATGNRLFRPRDANGENMEILAEKVSGSQLRAVYVLKRSVTQEKWPGALPTSERIADAAIEGVAQELERRLDDNGPRRS